MNKLTTQQSAFHNGSVHQDDIRDVTVLVSISERHDSLDLLYRSYAAELERLGKTFEFLFMIDGNFPQAQEQLSNLQSEGHPIRTVQFSKHFGESRALTEGFRHAKGTAILTLAPYFQVEPMELPKIFKAYDKGSDLVVTRRYPRRDPMFNRMQSKIYHFLVSKLTRTRFHDITCGMRLLKKEILPKFNLYGDLHRFIPVFAFHDGFSVSEIKVRQREEDTRLRIVRPGIYVRRVLDIITMFFLVKFTRKPLRFFGLIASVLFLLGGTITSYLAILKLWGQISLTNRPLLLLGVLLLVFGLQIFSVGLLGELILFCHAKDVKNYSVDQIIE